jgi:hypothetical protein
VEQTAKGSAFFKIIIFLARLLVGLLDVLSLCLADGVRLRTMDKDT